jgi:hypothetical protein
MPSVRLRTAGDKPPDDRISRLEAKVEALLERLPLQPPQQLHMPGSPGPGHPSGDTASSALAAHEFQQRPRGIRLQEALAQNSILNMSDGDRSSIKHLMDSALDESVHTHKARTTLFASASLLPTAICDEKTEAALLLETSIKTAGKRRKFDDVEEFNRAIIAEMPKLHTEQGYKGVLALTKYLMFINSIQVKFGWKAADFYHWRLQTFCADGDHDMIKQGHYNQQILDQLREKYSVVKGPNGAAPRPGAKQAYRGDKFCAYHGHHREHVTTDCTVLNNDPAKKGSRAPNFVEK